MGYLSRKDRLTRIAEDLLRVGAIDGYNWGRTIDWKTSNPYYLLELWVKNGPHNVCHRIKESELPLIERYDDPAQYPLLLAEKALDRDILFLFECSLTYGTTLCHKHKRKHLQK